jgi:uncharacterized protein (TIGR00303 family)
MGFLSEKPVVTFKKPLFAGILGNTVLSTIPGISGAGPTPEKTLLTPVLDAELITNGFITGYPVKPNTPTGCPTPAVITRAMMTLTGLRPLFINAGLMNIPTVPCLDVYGKVGKDPRFEDALPNAQYSFDQGVRIGEFLSNCSDLLVLGESVPGGTTTALCVLRALGYNASVSSSFRDNPVTEKEAVCSAALDRVRKCGASSPLEMVRGLGDPMMPVAAGIAESYGGRLILAGGTQMLAVSAIIRARGKPLPDIATTSYVRDDLSANVKELASKIGVKVTYIDPGFGNLGHAGLARYCIGEVKEGMGAGGAMYLAALLGHSPEMIRKTILETVNEYS